MNPTSSAIIDKKVVRFNTFNYGVDFFICRLKNLPIQNNYAVITVSFESYDVPSIFYMGRIFCDDGCLSPAGV